MRMWWLGGRKGLGGLSCRGMEGMAEVPVAPQFFAEGLMARQLREMHALQVSVGVIGDRGSGIRGRGLTCPLV